MKSQDFLTYVFFIGKENEKACGGGMKKMLLCSDEEQKARGVAEDETEAEPLA